MSVDAHLVGVRWLKPVLVGQVLPRGGGPPLEQLLLVPRWHLHPDERAVPVLQGLQCLPGRTTRRGGWAKLLSVVQAAGTVQQGGPGPVVCVEPLGARHALRDLHQCHRWLRVWWHWSGSLPWACGSVGQRHPFSLAGARHGGEPSAAWRHGPAGERRRPALRLTDDVLNLCKPVSKVALSNLHLGETHDGVMHDLDVGLHVLHLLLVRLDSVLQVLQLTALLMVLQGLVEHRHVVAQAYEGAPEVHVGLSDGALYLRDVLLQRADGEAVPRYLAGNVLEVLVHLADDAHQVLALLLHVGGVLLEGGARLLNGVVLPLLRLPQVLLGLEDALRHAVQLPAPHGVGGLLPLHHLLLLPPQLLDACHTGVQHTGHILRALQQPHGRPRPPAPAVGAAGLALGV
mmetsp:Transcript_32758/g.101551  ORF Transcript_32758/g.101551 Transcript_32758/m.101551 type:complete len:401 (+) Transcript_32758:231-1433(+)